MILAAAAALFTASAQQINPITRAMLEGYTELLRENPKDYQTLYERAAQYYRLSQYDRALDDLAKGLEYAPVKDAAYRVQAFSLMADAAMEMKNYDLALRSVDSALALEPDNYANIYKKGNICLLLDRPEEAYKAFASLQRLKSRSQEAYFGMAQASIMKGDNAEARDLPKEAESADPTNYITFCRVGDLYREMKEPQNAASNYLIGFTMAENPMRPLESLVDLGRSDYNAVAEALDFSINKSTSKIPLLYLKGSIANACGHYADARDAMTRLLAYPDGREAGAYQQLALADLALNMLPDALEAADKAIAISPSSELYDLKARVLVAKGDYAQALVETSKAITADHDNVDAQLTRAKAQLLMKEGKDALSTLNEILVSVPDNMEALLFRAYDQDVLLANGKAAIGDFNRIITEEPADPRSVAIQAIARAKAGKKIDADAQIEKLVKENPSADAFFYAAVFYAQTSNLEKGVEMVKRAAYEGFADKYLLETDMTPWLNIAPLRMLLK